MLFTAIDHPAIASEHVEKLADWYCKVLGMKVVARSESAPPAVLLGYDASTRGGTMIELMSVREPGPKPGTYTRFQPGIRHLALRVTNFEEAHAKLKSAGVEFLMEPMEGLGGGIVVSFRDPEGNELQIVQR